MTARGAGALTLGVSGAAAAVGVGLLFFGRRRTALGWPPDVRVGRGRGPLVDMLVARHIPIPRGLPLRLTSTQYATLFPSGAPKGGGWNRARCGAWACVYPRGTNEVVKITADVNEAGAASRVRNTPVPGALPVKAIYELRVPGIVNPDGTPRRLFAIVAPRYGRPNKLTRIVADCGATSGWPTDRADLRAPFLGCVTIEATNAGINRDLAFDFAYKLVGTVRDLEAIGVPWYDLHRGNLTQDANGEPMIVDLGPAMNLGALPPVGVDELARPR